MCGRYTDASVFSLGQGHVSSFLEPFARLNQAQGVLNIVITTCVTEESKITSGKKEPAKSTLLASSP